MIYRENGVIEVPDVTGLGATISDQWLRKMKKVII